MRTYLKTKTKSVKQHEENPGDWTDIVMKNCGVDSLNKCMLHLVSPCLFMCRCNSHAVSRYWHHTHRDQPKMFSLEQVYNSKPVLLDHEITKLVGNLNVMFSWRDIEEPFCAGTMYNIILQPSAKNDYNFLVTQINELYEYKKNTVYSAWRESKEKYVFVLGKCFLLRQRPSLYASVAKCDLIFDVSNYEETSQELQNNLAFRTQLAAKINAQEVCRLCMWSLL